MLFRLDTAQFISLISEMAFENSGDNFKAISSCRNCTLSNIKYVHLYWANA